MALPLIIAATSFASILLQRNKASSVPVQQKKRPMPSQSELRQAFLAVYDDLKHFLLNECKDQYALPEEHVSYIARLMDYTVQGGKLNRGLSVVETVLYMQPDASDETLYKARVVGWCIEWLQAFFLVADDIMDASITRRGQPCWYKLEDVGMVACNDYLILESQIYRILKHYFAPQCADSSQDDTNATAAVYYQLLNQFHETTFQTELGQLNDTRIQLLDPETKQLDLNRLNITTYNHIVKYKTSYYSFYLPIVSGYILLGLSEQKNRQLFQLTENICIQMGEYFQIQDDFLDCYGSPEVIGKIGRDIEEGKCCWIVIQALNKCTTPEQKQIIQDHYGRDNENDVAIIKQLYSDLDIVSVYKQYERETCKQLTSLIDDLVQKQQVLGVHVNGQVFHSFLDKISSRTK